MSTWAIWLAAILFVLPSPASAEDLPPYQKHFPPEEFKARWEKVFDRIGDRALALVQGAQEVDGYKVFRQSNEFYYLCGVEVPHAYILLDGRSREVALYLPQRDEGRDGNKGRILSAGDAERIMEWTGVDAVHGSEMLTPHLEEWFTPTPPPQLFTPFSPAEGRLQSRDAALHGLGRIAADPWDGRPAREQHFIRLLRTRFPELEVQNLSPILDALRNIKSPREIELIRRASHIAALGIKEAMRCTKPGAMEYQLDAAARFVFLANGAMGRGYTSITAGGTNAWMGHYCSNSSKLEDGDLVLMDFAPDYGYYTSDVTRMWPVNGKFTKEQRELCGFILEIHDALLKRTRPGITAAQVLDESAEEMEAIFRKRKWSKLIYEKAARAAVKFRGHLTHPVGMAVHDVWDYKTKPLEPGVVFALDPMLWVKEEKLYIRIENLVVVTQDGAENLSDAVPSDLDDIERLMREDGILQKRPPAYPAR